MTVERSLEMLRIRMDLNRAIIEREQCLREMAALSRAAADIEIIESNFTGEALNFLKEMWYEKHDQEVFLSGEIEILEEKYSKL